MKKRDGEYYFEAVAALFKDHFTKEHEAQFLALCPLCAAMYNEFVKHDEGAMESLKDACCPLQKSVYFHVSGRGYALYIYKFEIMVLLRVKAKGLLSYWAVRDLGIGSGSISHWQG